MVIVIVKMTDFGEINMQEAKIMPEIILTDLILQFDISKITFNENRGSALGSKYILNQSGQRAVQAERKSLRLGSLEAENQTKFDIQDAY